MLQTKGGILQPDMRKKRLLRRVESWKDPSRPLVSLFFLAGLF